MRGPYLGVVARQSFNALGDATESIQNYTGAGPGNDHDVTVRQTYTPARKVATLTAVNPTTGDQTTIYQYGTTLADSAVASNSLLRYTIYPDATDANDRVALAYNRQGEVIKKTDQNGTVHEYVIDKLGRQTNDKVPTLGDGINGAVQRIAQAFDVRGLLEKITSYSAPTGGSVVNEVQRVYNDFGQLATEYQAHSGAVNTSTSPKVQYAYADGSANTARPLTLTYPNGRVLEYDYGTADGDNDQLSRVAALTFEDLPTSSSSSSSSTEVAAYTFQGLSTFKTVTYPEPNVARTFAFTLFSQPTDWLWKQSSTTIDGVAYTYDRVGNRTSRKNAVAASANDELYSYDGLQRLTDMARGTLSAELDRINDLKLAQDWNLDATGNWSGFQNVDAVTPANNLQQARVSNLANEIELISSRFGPEWVTPTYDRAGNMTSFFAQPPENTTAVYDAWNRMVAISGWAPYAYRYDGLHRRVTKLNDDNFLRNFYYSSAWQVLEEHYEEAASNPDRQFVWGLQYIDDLVLRDRTVSDPLDERLYALQDANWNVTSICDTSGDVQERYRYTAYGMCQVLEPDFDPRSDNTSLYDWETRYASYRWDSESGLYQVRYRYYHPLLGCWLTRDPLEYADGYSLEEYASNSPLGKTDPFGELGGPETGAAIAVGTVAAGLVVGVIGYLIWRRWSRKVPCWVCDEKVIVEQQKKYSEGVETDPCDPPRERLECRLVGKPVRNHRQDCIYVCPDQLETIQILQPTGPIYLDTCD